MFTFDGDFAIRPGANGVICSARVRSLLWNITELQIRVFIANLSNKISLDICFVLRFEVPFIFIIIRIAISYANQRVLSIFLLSCDCAIGGVWYKLIKNWWKKLFINHEYSMDYLFICPSSRFPACPPSPPCSVIPALLFSSTMRKRRDSTTHKKMIFCRCLKTIMGASRAMKKENPNVDEKNSHKIFIVMLATLLPCLFSTMHEYTPLSVRLSPLGNSKAGVVISTSLESKRFQ